MGLNAYSSGLITRMKIYKIISKRNTATFVKILAKICIRIKANSPKEAGPQRNKPEGQTFPFKLMFLMQLFRISMSDIVKKNNEREREGASISEGRYKESFSFRREGEANPGIRRLISLGYRRLFKNADVMATAAISYMLFQKCSYSIILIDPVWYFSSSMSDASALDSLLSSFFQIRRTLTSTLKINVNVSKAAVTVYLLYFYCILKFIILQSFHSSKNRKGLSPIFFSIESLVGKVLFF